MSLVQQAVAEIDSANDFFKRSTRNLNESHSTVSPAPGMMTAAQQVAHAAQTIEWFVEGAFRPEGFDTDFEAHAKAVNACTSLKAAHAWFDKAIATAKATLASKTDADLLAPLPPGPIMGGAPRIAIVSGITDHTAHHRGALTVYARLQGVVPPMPYMDM
ncbi:MAG: DinB family protein [Vicinamibacterales bacterium]